MVKSGTVVVIFFSYCMSVLRNDNDGAFYRKMIIFFHKVKKKGEWKKQRRGAFRCNSPYPFRDPAMPLMLLLMNRTDPGTAWGRRQSADLFKILARRICGNCAIARRSDDLTERSVADISCGEDARNGCGKGSVDSDKSFFVQVENPPEHL